MRRYITIPIREAGVAGIIIFLILTGISYYFGIFHLNNLTLFIIAELLLIMLGLGIANMDYRWIRVEE